MKTILCLLLASYFLTFPAGASHQESYILKPGFVSTSIGEVPKYRASNHWVAGDYDYEIQGVNIQIFSAISEKTSEAGEVIKTAEYSSYVVIGLKRVNDCDPESLVNSKIMTGEALNSNLEISLPLNFEVEGCAELNRSVRLKN